MNFGERSFKKGIPEQNVINPSDECPILTCKPSHAWLQDQMSVACSPNPLITVLCAVLRLQLDAPCLPFRGFMCSSPPVSMLPRCLALSHLMPSTLGNEDQCHIDPMLDVMV